MLLIDLTFCCYIKEMGIKYIKKNYNQKDIFFYEKKYSITKVLISIILKDYLAIVS